MARSLAVDMHNLARRSLERLANQPGNVPADHRQSSGSGWEQGFRAALRWSLHRVATSSFFW